MEIRPGDVIWISPNESNGIASDYTHPHVVIHDDSSNKLTVCAVTSILKRAKGPGNVLLEEGEANLPRQSVVVISKVFTIDKTLLGEYIGRLTEERMSQVRAGMRFLQSMTQRREHGHLAQRWLNNL